MNLALSKSSALVTRKFREFFWPTVLATMAMQLGAILDSIIVGNLIGADAMAGVGVCMPLNQILAAVSFLLTVGAGSMIAVAAGARQQDEANRIFHVWCIRQHSNPFRRHGQTCKPKRPAVPNR